MSVLASTTVGHNDEELAFDTKMLDHFINEANIDEVIDPE
jgi:hypothetical protein